MKTTPPSHSFHLSCWVRQTGEEMLGKLDMRVELWTELEQTFGNWQVNNGACLEILCDEAEGSDRSWLTSEARRTKQNKTELFVFTNELRLPGKLVSSDLLPTAAEYQEGLVQSTSYSSLLCLRTSAVLTTPCYEWKKPQWTKTCLLPPLYLYCHSFTVYPFITSRNISLQNKNHFSHWEEKERKVFVVSFLIWEKANTWNGKYIQIFQAHLWIHSLLEGVRVKI